MAKRMFEDFPPISREQWMEKIKADLKGKSIDSLKWTSEEGLELFPVYTREDLPEADWLQGNYPGLAPYMRGAAPYGSSDGWEIRHDFRAEQVDEVVQIINENAEGLEGIGLVLGLPFREFLFDWKERQLPIARPRDGIYINTAEDLATILGGVDWTGRKLHMRAGHAVLPVYSFLAAHWQEATGMPLRGTLDADPFNRLGNDPSNTKLFDLMLEDTAAIIHHLAAAGNEDFKVLRISLEPHHFLGANAIQQISSALSMAVDYIHHFGERFGLAPKQVIQHLHFQFPIDTDFFTEMAKLRAFRVLLGRVLGHYEGAEDMVGGVFVHGQGAARSMSVLDQHVNILRSTTQAMSAILGGADSVSVSPFNGLGENADAHAVRVARNIQLVLRDEASFGTVVDPAGGSYFLEKLTWDFCEKAWGLFLEMEQTGGYMATWKEGKLLRQLWGQREKLNADIAKGKKKMVGVNVFPNAKDEPPVLLTTGYVREYPLPKRDFFEVPVQERAGEMAANLAAVGNLGSALEARFARLDGRLGQTGQLERLAEPFEALRTEAHEYREDGEADPIVLLLPYGSLHMRKARGNFAANLFNCGGFTTHEGAHPTDMAAAVEELKEIGPAVVVFCASNEAYFDAAGKQFMQDVRAAAPEAHLVLAGRPEGWEALQEGGHIDSAIHAGMDMVAYLQDMQIKTGIKMEVVHEA